MFNYRMLKNVGRGGLLVSRQAETEKAIERKTERITERGLQKKNGDRFWIKFPRKLVHWHEITTGENIASHADNISIEH